MTAYIGVTAAYWILMLSDGALRMLVLLHFHTLGFTPVQLAYLFLLYEFAGMVTNLFAGWIAARVGMAFTLYVGLGLQIAALLALAALDQDWVLGLSVAYVMVVQGVSGVAKDLAKMSSKSAVKILAPSRAGALFRWVAALTGSKNAVKGLGFLLGAALLAVAGFQPTVLAMAAGLLITLLTVVLAMPNSLPGGRKDVMMRDVYSRSSNINWLSAARVFLFGARDVWFVVGIPIYFYAVLSDGSEAGNRAAFFAIGSFMALWIILYGAVQAAAPRLLRAAKRPQSELVGQARLWAWTLSVIPAVLALAVLLLPSQQPVLTGVLIVGLLVFGAIFAVNSSLHSYLILAFSKSERVTLDVGFYYMANAGGRLLGTALSGLAYQLGGLALMFVAASVMVGLSALAASRLSPVPESVPETVPATVPAPAPESNP